MKHDEDSDGFGMVVGTGIPLIQAFAMLPGLLPFLLLAGVFALPLLIPVLALGLAAGALIGIPAGLWAIGRRLMRLATRRGRPPAISMEGDAGAYAAVESADLPYVRS